MDWEKEPSDCACEKGLQGLMMPLRQVSLRGQSSQLPLVLARAL